VLSVESRTPAGSLTDGADDVVKIAVLRQARDGAGLQKRSDLAGLGGRRQDDHGGGGAGGSDPCRRLHPVEAGQAVVDQHDVGLDAGTDVKRGFAVRYGRDDANVGGHVEEKLEGFSEHVVVLHEDDVDRFFVGHTGSIGTLLDGKEERIVRLAAVVDLDLELGMSVADGGDEVCGGGCPFAEKDG
jgi:hypothetical protein